MAKKSHCLTTTEFNPSVPDNSCDVRRVVFSGREYFKRVSQTIERGILLFVVLLTLLGNYAIHSHLMNDVLLS